MYFKKKLLNYYQKYKPPPSKSSPANTSLAKFDLRYLFFRSTAVSFPAEAPWISPVFRWVSGGIFQQCVPLLALSFCCFLCFFTRSWRWSLLRVLIIPLHGRLWVVSVMFGLISMILVISLSFLFLLCESLGGRRLIYLLCWKKLKMKSEVGNGLVKLITTRLAFCK